MQNNDGLTTCRKQWLQVCQAVTRVLAIYMEKLEISDRNSNGSPHSVWEASTLFRGCLHEKTRTGTSFIPRWLFDRGRTSSVDRAFHCKEGGRGFDSRGRTITQGLKMTEKWRYFLCTASGETFAWLGWPRKMAVPSPLGDVKYSVPN